jgi:hypothetical protein
MTESILNEEFSYAQTLQFAVSSIFNTLFAESIDNIVERNKDSVSSFLSRNFRYWSGDLCNQCKKCFINDVNPIIRNYYYDHNKTYPNSFTKIDLDITYLYKIQYHLLDCEHNHFFMEIKHLRDTCFHSHYVSKKYFLILSDQLRKSLSQFFHLNKREKETYLTKLNYILQNLLFEDAKSLLNEFDKRILLLRSKDKEKININTRIIYLENERKNLLAEMDYLNSLIAERDQQINDFMKLNK